MNKPNPSPRELPLELADEKILHFVINFKECVPMREHFSDMEDFWREVLDDVYSAGLQAGLALAGESLPGEKEKQVFKTPEEKLMSAILGSKRVFSDLEIQAWNAYRAEALSRIEEKIKSLEDKG